MKFVIDVEDALFQEAAKVARRLGVSRNEFYPRALKLFLERQEEMITARLNEVYAEAPAEVDAVLTQMQFATLRHSRW